MATQTPSLAGDWLPLMEYAMRKGVSLSTLRRYIKAKKVEYRLEDGRYLLWDAEAQPGDRRLSPAVAPSTDAIAAQSHAVARASTQDARALEHELKRAQEEISELKTLISLYEEQMLGNGKDSH